MASARFTWRVLDGWRHRQPVGHLRLGREAQCHGHGGRFARHRFHLSGGAAVRGRASRGHVQPELELGGFAGVISQWPSVIGVETFPLLPMTNADDLIRGKRGCRFFLNLNRNLNLDPSEIMIKSKIKIFPQQHFLRRLSEGGVRIGGSIRRAVGNIHRAAHRRQHEAETRVALVVRPAKRAGARVAAH